MDAKQPRNTAVTARVLEYLDKHANQTLYLGDIASDLNLPERSVRDGMSRIIRDNRANAKERMQVQSQGRAWLWKSSTAQSANQQSDTLFVQVYAGKNGVLLAEDENGVLYKLVRIE